MTAGPTDTATLEPLPPPEPEAPAPRRLPPARWVRENLFNTWYNSLLTVVFGAALGWATLRAVHFVFFGARWEIIQTNLTLFMVGRYPRDQLFRPWLAILIVSAAAGVGAGLAARTARRSDQLPARPRPGQIPARRRPLRGRPRPGRWDAFKRAAPGLALLAVLLAFARTPLPALLVAASLAVCLAGRTAGTRLPDKAARWLPLLYLGTVLGAFLALTAGGPGWDSWGGLLLTLYLALGGIVLSFPIGVLLALGRRSSFPGVRLVCVGYIELIRGVPLITLLLMGQFMLGFFFPRGFPRPGLVVRALIAIVLFTAAYVAEIVRGGLQGVPRGQSEAAQAIGLSPVKTTLLIVLPQALRNVIPALVGQFISLFKDTSLVAIIGLLDLLFVAQAITQQPDFLGQGLQAEVLVFASFVYWAFCYSMSRASQRLERRLGVGER